MKIKRRIVIANRKGGVGKTTTAVALAYGLADLGHSVLLIDLDYQANATYQLDFPIDLPDMRNFFLGRRELVESVYKTDYENLHLFPGSSDMAGLEADIASRMAREAILRKGLTASELEYDYAIMDTNPYLGVVLHNAMTAATEVVIPVAAHFSSVGGMMDMFETMDRIRQDLNPELGDGRILLTRLDRRTSHAPEVAEEVRAAFEKETLDTFVRENVAVAEAYTAQQPVQVYDRRCNAAKDYTALVKEIDTLNYGKGEAQHQSRNSASPAGTQS